MYPDILLTMFPVAHSLSHVTIQSDLIDRQRPYFDTLIVACPFDSAVQIPNHKLLNSSSGKQDLAAHGRHDASVFAQGLSVVETRTPSPAMMA